MLFVSKANHLGPWGQSSRATPMVALAGIFRGQAKALIAAESWYCDCTTVFDAFVLHYLAKSSCSSRG